MVKIDTLQYGDLVEIQRQEITLTKIIKENGKFILGGLTNDSRQIFCVLAADELVKLVKQVRVYDLIKK
jgi:hypothetical protein